MRLTEQQIRIISTVCFNADLSCREVADRIGCREHVVRSTTSKLIEQGVLVPHVFTNPYAVGLTEYQVFFSILSAGAKPRGIFVDALKKEPAISWLAPVGGPYEFDCLVQTRSFYELAQFLDLLSERTPDVALRRSVAALIRFTYFAPKYLFWGSSSEMPGEYISYGLVPEPQVIDSLDEKILQAITNEPQLSTRLLSKNMGIPGATLAYRLKSLRDRGIISRFGYLIMPFSLGVVPYLFLVELRHTSADIHRRLFEFCHHHPNISYMMQNLGEWNYQLGVRVHDAREIPSITSEIQERFSGVLERLLPLPVYQPTKVVSCVFPEKGT